MSSRYDVCAEETASAGESVADGSASVLESVSGQECFGTRVCERITCVSLIKR